MHSNCSGPLLGYPALVSCNTLVDNRATINHPTLQKSRSTSTSKNISDLPSLKATESTGSTFIGKALSHYSLSTEAKEILAASWRAGTQKQYGTPIRRWEWFCSQRNIHPFSASIESIIEFLTTLYTEDAKYSTICTARSALASVVIVPGYKSISDHPLISGFITGVFNTRPTSPKYTYTWDTDILLRYLKELSPNEALTFKLLAHKTVTLPAPY